MGNLKEKQFRKNELSPPSKQHLTSTETLFRNDMSSLGTKSMGTPTRLIGNGQNLIKRNATNSKQHAASKMNCMRKVIKIRHDRLKIQLLLRKLRMIYL